MYDTHRHSNGSGPGPTMALIAVTVVLVAVAARPVLARIRTVEWITAGAAVLTALIIALLLTARRRRVRSRVKVETVLPPGFSLSTWQAAELDQRVSDAQITARAALLAARILSHGQPPAWTATPEPGPGRTAPGQLPRRAGQP